MGASNLIEDALATAMRASDGAAADVAPALRTATEVFPEARPAIEAHPSASPETKDLVNYLNTRQHLPMDAESLQQRAGDMNFSYDGYHGAPRDIHGFDNRYSGNQGWWGGHHYATTSPVDASENYAHPLGPDIINRIGAKQDELLNNFHPDDVKRWFKETRGIDLTPEEAVHHENVSAWSKAVAQDQLGITNSGAVYPVKMRMKNPVRVDSPNQTFWHHNVNFDDNGDITEEGGPAHDLMQHLNDQLHNYGMGEREVDKVMGNVGEHVVDNGGIDPQSLRQIMNDHAHYLTDENGEMVSPGHVLSEVFQKMGHDGIIMNTDHFAPSRGRIGMAGTGGNTQHYIVFDPKNIRSRFGAFDPFKSNSSRLSDARGGLVERPAKGGGGSAIAEAITRLLGPAERPGLMELTPKGSGYSSVPGKPAFVNIPSIGEVEARPIPQIMDSASSYMAARGMPGGHAIGAFPELDIENARRIAKAFANMKHAPDDPDVRRAYEALAAETMDQFKAAKDTGIDFTAIRGADPYAKSPAIGYADIAHRGNLSFFPTDAGFGSSSEFDPTKNPLLKRVGRIGDLDNATVNDAFRVVHDLYGHYGPGNPFFRGPGEERAYQLHRQMFSPDALPAMTTETRGQNSWLNYGPHEKSNASASSADTTYADQKTGIMPPWTYKADGGSISDAMRIAKDVGGALTAPQVMLTDANGVQYDQQGNVISQSAPAPAAPPATIQAGAPVTASPTPPTTAPTAPAPAPASPAMPQALQIAHQAVNDPALFDALMQQHLNPNADIKSYEKMRDEVARQPTNVQQATHLGAKPQRNVTVDAPLLGGTYNLGPEPYDTAAAKSLALQTLYDVKTAPFYSNPVTEPFALASDTAEGALTGDPLSAAMAVGFGPFGKYTKAAGLGTIGYLNSSNDAQAGPERWFSKLFEAAHDLPMQKMGGEQALAMLRKVASPEEIRWTGTDAFLTNQRQVTKQDLIDYIEKNRLQLKEHTFGGPGPTSLDQINLTDIPAEIRDRWQSKLQPLQDEAEALKQQMDSAKASMDDNAGYDVDYNRYYGVYRTASAAYSNAMAKIIRMNEGMKQEYADSIGGLAQRTKYHKYSTQGGDGYRETLYQYQRPDSWANYVAKLKADFRQSLMAKMAEMGTPVEEREGDANALSSAPLDAMARQLGRGDEYEVMSRNVGNRSYRSGHWDQSDVVFHTRGQTLSYDPPGANRPYKVHNVDETQSDAGQEGRKRGFNDYDATKRYNAGLQRIGDEQRKIMKDRAAVLSGIDEQMGPQPLYSHSTQAEFNDYHSRRQDLVQSNPEIARLNDALEANRTAMENHQRSAPKRGEVPLMPFIGSTEGWTDRAIKHELDKALDSGADYFSWTPGEEHAARYNLRNHIGELTYDPDNGYFKAYDLHGNQVAFETVKDPSELDSYVGKEVADRLREGAANHRKEPPRQYEIVVHPHSNPEENDGIISLAVKETKPDGTEEFVGGNDYPASWRTEGRAREWINDQLGRFGESAPFTLKGEGLEMGGEGMINYYGKIYLNRVKKMLEKATGIKNIPVEEITPQTANGPRKQLGIKLTDEMREKARFSDFARGGTVTGFEKRDTNPAVSRALALTSEF